MARVNRGDAGIGHDRLEVGMFGKDELALYVGHEMRLVAEALTKSLDGLEKAGKTIVSKGWSSSGAEVVRVSKDLARSQCLVLLVGDGGFADISALSVVQDAMSVGPNLKCIALAEAVGTMRIRSMLEAGVRGYCALHERFEDLVEAIFAVHSGKTYLVAPVAGIVADAFAGRGHEEAPILERLSSRERQIWELACRGWSAPAIGELLCLSHRTIETQRASLKRKVGAGTIADLVRIGVEEGVV